MPLQAALRIRGGQAPTASTPWQTPVLVPRTEAELDYYQRLPQRGVSEPLLLDPECWALKRKCGTRRV